MRFVHITYVKIPWLGYIFFLSFGSGFFQSKQTKEPSQCLTSVKRKSAAFALSS